MSPAPDMAANGAVANGAADIARGVVRLLTQMNYASLSEFSLRSGRRADICALDRKGTLLIVEIKSSLADFRADTKWLDYEDWCDRFFFAVSPGFPSEVLPEDRGLILADRFGAEIVRPAGDDGPRLSGARRNEITRRFALTAARRLTALDEDAVALRGGAAPALR